MYETKSDWFFIVNPHAGSGKTMCEWIPAEKKLHELGVPYTTAYTDYKRHATSLAYGAAREGYRRIMAVGGDGSIHEAVNGVLQFCDESGANPESFIMAVAPIGSGNDWIKSLNVPHDISEVMDLIHQESFGKMDVIRIECNSLERKSREVHYMANIGGIGFDSHVCERVNEMKERGRRNKMIYLNALRHAVLHLKPINIQVIADGEEKFCGECISMALGNGKYSGGGMIQVPKASMTDGLVDVTIVPKLSIFKIFKYMPLLYTGDIGSAEELIAFQCKELEVIPLDAQSNDIIELDGEVVGRIPSSISATGLSLGVLVGKKKN